MLVSLLRRVAVAALFSPLTAIAQTTPRLTAVLSQLDAASARFRSAEADFTQVYYEAVVHENTTQPGRIYFERKGTGTQMGAVLMGPDGAGVDRVLSFDNGTLTVFDPHIDQIQLLSAGANGSQAETFLTLGFGGSGKALAAAWTISDLGPDTLVEGDKHVAVEKLDLVSRQASIRNNFSHVTLWIDPARGVSLRQVFYTPSGDKRTTNYTHIQLNERIDKGRFAIHKDAKTTVIRH